MLDRVREAVSAVRAEGVEPLVHPNGFIRLKLSPYMDAKLHVWPDRDDVPRQEVHTTIHDHRFDMNSTVIMGALAQKQYTPHLDYAKPTHEIHVATPVGGEETRLAPTGVCVSCRDFYDTRTHFVDMGQSYDQLKYSFHDTHWFGLTATLMTKTNEDPDHKPRVLVGIGQKPDNTFVRTEVPVELLWEYIDRVITDASL